MRRIYPEKEEIPSLVPPTNRLCFKCVLSYSELFHADEMKIFRALLLPARTVALVPHVYLTIIDRTAYATRYRPTTQEEELPCEISL